MLRQRPRRPSSNSPSGCPTVASAGRSARCMPKWDGYSLCRVWMPIAASLPARGFTGGRSRFPSASPDSDRRARPSHLDCRSWWSIPSNSPWFLAFPRNPAGGRKIACPSHRTSRHSHSTATQTSRGRLRGRAIPHPGRTHTTRLLSRRLETQLVGTRNDPSPSGHTGRARRKSTPQDAWGHTRSLTLPG